MKTWQDTGFTWLRTADDSPTLSLGVSQESMHHSGGALTETLVIYGEPLREIFETLEKPRIFSLGLGLGYVEMVTAAQSIKSDRPFEMLTMESVAALVTTFDAWVREEMSFDDERRLGLDEVAKRVGHRMSVVPDQIRATLRAVRDSGSWRIEGALSPTQLPTGQFNGLMYDAFSAKTTPELWTEEFLKNLLSKISAPDCLFSSYACTGNLKRALKSELFQFEARQGFKSKRDSTVARRGRFISRPSL